MVMNKRQPSYGNFFLAFLKAKYFQKLGLEGLIFPLIKGGPVSARTDVGKYRGITLLSIIGKIYTDILNRIAMDGKGMYFIR